MTCTRCEGTGFINLMQVDEDTLAKFDELGDVSVILDWMKAHPDSDCSVCDCCGNGESWHGTAGEHYNAEDPLGKDGPYAYNGGLCKCH